MPPTPRRHPTRTGTASSRRAPTQHMAPVRESGRRTTVRNAAPAVAAPAAPAEADPAPAAEEVPAAAPAPASEPTRTSGSSRSTSSTKPGAGRAGAASRRQTSAKSERHEREATGRRQRKQGSPLPLIIVGTVILAALITALAWKPMQRSHRLHTIDAATTDPSKLDAALAAADEWMALVDQDPREIDQFILHEHGPVAVQVHCAVAAKLYPALVSIAERPSITPADRALALRGAATVYDPERHGSERLPGGMDDWIEDPKASDEVAAAALALIAKADRDDAFATLVRIAGTGATRPARADAALTALAPLVDGSTCGQILRLLSTPAASRVIANAAITDAVARNCNHDLPAVLALAFGKDPAIRTFALTCLSHCTLIDDPANDEERVSLAAKFHPLLDPKGDAEVLAAAVHACAALELSPCMDDLIALAPSVDGRSLPQDVTSDYLSQVLGERFVLTGTPKSQALTAQLVAKLGAALADGGTRPVAAKALGRITQATTPGLRAALDQLADVGDQASIATLKILVGKTYGRDDLVKASGDDAASWKAMLAREHTVSARVAELGQWLAANGKFNRVADGVERLQASVGYLEKAMADTNAWLNDTTWTPPLGSTREDIEDLDRRLKMLEKDVKPALAGAQQNPTAAEPDKPGNQ